MNQDLKSFYNKVYTVDDKTSVEKLHAQKTASPTDRYEACVKVMSERFKGGTILEIGAGSGYLARSLDAAAVPFDRMVLSEYSDTCIEILKRDFQGPRFEVMPLDAENIPETVTEKYDAIILIALIEHFIDPIQVMKNLKRLLKPGGFVYIDTPNIAKFSRRIKLLFGRFPSTASLNEGLTTYEGKETRLYDEGHLHYFSYRSLSAMLTERCGYVRTERGSYAAGYKFFGPKFDNLLATARPELFSDVVLLGYV